MDTERKTNCNPDEHREHICELERDGDWETLKCVTADPKVRCENCGAEAHSARNVCMPAALG